MDTPPTLSMSNLPNNNNNNDNADEEGVRPVNMEAQAYCATVIANLEGWRGGTLPCTKDAKRMALDQLDTRVRRLENIESIHPPPPMDTPSWDSLTYRVARLHRNMPQGPPGAMSRLMATPSHIAPTMALLQSTVAAIGGVGPQSWASFVEDDGGPESDEMLLQAAAQFLCYLAGKRGYRVVGSFDLKPNCILALDMSLDADANSGFYVGPAFHNGPPRPPRPRSVGTVFVARSGRPPSVQKMCCGCCACPCHACLRDAMPRRNVVRWVMEKYRADRRASRFGVKARIVGVFRRLAFWRRRPNNVGPENDSDCSSYTSRSSSTIA